MLSLIKHILDRFKGSKQEKQENQSSRNDVISDSLLSTIFSLVNCYVTSNEIEYYYDWKNALSNAVLTSDDTSIDEIVGKPVKNVAYDVFSWWNYKHPKKMKQLCYLNSVHRMLINNEITINDVDWNEIEDLIRDKQNLLNHEYVTDICKKECQLEDKKVRKMAKIVLDIYPYIKGNIEQ